MTKNLWYRSKMQDKATEQIFDTLSVILAHCDDENAERTAMIAVQKVAKGATYDEIVTFYHERDNEGNYRPDKLDAVELECYNLIFYLLTLIQ